MALDLKGLLRWTGEFSGAPLHVERLSSVLLQCYDNECESFNWKSFLNNDGSPLQVCVTYGPKGHKVRLIGDPASHISDPNIRFGYARKALTELLVVTKTNSLAVSCEETLRHLLPINGQEANLRAGSLWLAAGLEGGLAVYINMRWGKIEQRWCDTVNWLMALLPCSQEAKALMHAIKPHSVIASAGLEGTTIANARVKVYWRLEKPALFHLMGISLLTHSAFRDFLVLLVSDRSLPLSGMLFSASFGLYDGKLYDIKIDLCAHCLPRPENEWVQVLQECCGAFNLAPLSIANSLSQRQCEMAFIGFGLDRFGNPRLNLYLKTSQLSP